MPFLIKMGYEITQGRKVEKPRSSENYLFWKDFVKHGEKYKDEKELAETKRDFPAAILQSGGSTGTPKGIVLSNGNFNASTIQAKRALPDLCSDDIILGIMPVFHGFGLQVSLSDAFNVGAKVVLIPQFKPAEFDKLIKKSNPSVLVGVPTLFEALTHNEGMNGVSLANLKYVIAGGDSFSKQKVQAINNFLHEHGAKTNFTQGYGMTEALSAVTFDLKYASREGSIGIPWPGTYVQICKPGTDEEVPYGEDGEICISGPCVMLGYYNNEKETNDALHIHKDGNVWLHSGDIGFMDKDGFVTYRQRIKRMIVSSGYNVYPAQIEEVLETHPGVLDSTVIGIPHPYKIEVPKAYIVLKPGFKEAKVKEELEELCKKNLAKYSQVKEFEFRKSLPKTMVGKVDFRKLQEENKEKRLKENGQK
jgi:long-chain acyl-CoA synthetase